MQQQREQAIRERAYEIWEQEGCPDGKDLDHWRRAEAQLNMGEIATTTDIIVNNQLDALMQSNGLNINDWDAPIYRVFSLRWFKDMITQRRNGLIRPAKWDDPFENFFLKCKVQTQSGEIGSLKPIHDGWYGQCWTHVHPALH